MLNIFAIFLRQGCRRELLARGIFVCPEVSRFVGKAMSETLKAAETIAKTTGYAVQVHGAETAMTYTGAVKNMFGAVAGIFKADYHLRLMSV